jgi:hypothetical protein
MAFFSPFSWLIRLAYWSPISHVYIRFDLDGIPVVFQASGLKINLVSDALFNSEEIVCKEFTLPISSENKEALKTFSINQLGKPYNIMGIFGMGLVRIGQLLGIKIKSPFKYNGSSDFCSELVSYILKTYENINIGDNPADESPQSVLNLLSKLE